MGNDSKNQGKGLYSRAGAAMTVYHRLAGYCPTAVEAKNSRIKVLAGLAPSEALREDLFHASHLAPGGLLATPVLCLHFPWCSRSVCISVQMSPFYKDTSCIGLLSPQQL